MLARPDGDARWYVVHTIPHREMRAEMQLRTQGFETFLPAHWKTTRHARQFRTVKSPFFPRYLFVQLSAAAHRWRTVNGTFGVSRLIMEGDRPKPVPPGVVEGFQALTGKDGTLSFEPQLRVGQSVRILSGPFAGLIGRLAKLESDGRVRVLLEIMGGTTPIVAARESLAPTG